jgi:NADH-quinone oxidoreductase subunit J
VVTAQLPEAFGSPAQVGTDLFSKYMLPFEVTSVLLLVAMIGAIVLTKGEKK